jgi:DNA-binding TFAR19-related protein (PDSD5 family)
MKLHKSILLSIVAIVLTMGVSNAQVQRNISDQDLKDLLSRIDTDTARFAKSADKAMDKSGFNRTAREDDLNAHLKRFRNATEALKNDHTTANAKSQFETVLHHGVAIENFLKRNPLDGVQEDWTTLRADLGELARAFNITWEQGHALGARVGEADIKNLLQHIEDMADKYKLTLDAALDSSPLNNTSAEDEINSVNSDFRKATRRLEDNRTNDSAPDDAKEVLGRGKRINDFLEKHNAKLTPEVQSAWAAVRTDLDRLARLYSINSQWQQ